MSPLKFGETFGSVVEGPLPGVTLSAHPSNSYLPAHEHAAAYICVVLSGSFLERGCADRHHCGERTIVAHPPGERHSDIFGPEGALCLNVYMEFSPAEPFRRRSEPNLTAAIQELAAETVKGHLGDRLTAEGAAAEIKHVPWGLSQNSQGSDRVSMVLEALDDAPEAPWTLGELAMIAGRHPTHLARAFRARTGMSIGTYRRRRRAIRLCMDLRTSTRGLSELALLHGYADQAHMTREVRRFTGIAPSAFRGHANSVQDRVAIPSLESRWR